VEDRHKVRFPTAVGRLLSAFQISPVKPHPTWIIQADSAATFLGKRGTQDERTSRVSVVNSQLRSARTKKVSVTARLEGTRVPITKCSKGDTDAMPSALSAQLESLTEYTKRILLPKVDIHPV
jgi:hypothetical protein